MLGEKKGFSLGYKWFTSIHNGVVIELEKNMINTTGENLEDECILSNILEFGLERKSR